MFKIVCLMFFSVLSQSVIAVSATQPSVAIKEPGVGDSVKSYARKILNTDIIREEMEAAFRATRKFRVLSRDKKMLEAVLDEQSFAKTELTKGDAAESGQLSNANYLIIPVVQDFKFYRKHEPLPNFDSKYRRRDFGLLFVNAQMIDTDTGEVKTTFSMKTTFSTPEEIVNSRSGVPSSVHFSKMSKKIAADLANQFVASVYPMKVVKRLQNGQIILNRGADGGLKVGDKLSVFSVGEELIDPDTGESLGSSEEFIATAKVLRINPKITFAKIITETDAIGLPIKPGDIVRRPQ